MTYALSTQAQDAYLSAMRAMDAERDKQARVCAMFVLQGEHSLARIAAERYRAAQDRGDALMAVIVRQVEG